MDLVPSRVLVRQIPDWAATDWRRFSVLLQASLGLALSQPLPSTEAVDVAVDYLTACIQLTTASVVPKKRVCSYSRPWWHPGLTDLRQDMHHWHRRWLRSGGVFAWERYLLGRRAFWTAIVTTKQDSWRRLCSETSRGTFGPCTGNSPTREAIQLWTHWSWTATWFWQTLTRLRPWP